VRDPFAYIPQHLGQDVLVPDIAAWRRENLAALPDTPVIDLTPDWVCEILSPSTFDLDLRRKLPAYARHRVSWLWLVDTAQRSLEVLVRESGTWAAHGSYHGDDLVHAEPFDAVGIEWSSIFAV